MDTRESHDTPLRPITRINPIKLATTLIYPLNNPDNPYDNPYTVDDRNPALP